MCPANRNKDRVPLAVIVLLSSASLANLLCAAPASPESWPRFRGPNGSGRAPDSERLPAEIGPRTNVVWKTSLPGGHSSPVIHGKHIYLTAERDGNLLTLALDRTSGATLWEEEAKYEKLDNIHRIGSHAQPTVATDGERVVSLFGSCGLFCYDTAGELLWRKRMGPFNDDWGAGSSPIIVGRRVIVNQDHDSDSFLAAFDLHTGDEIWRTDRSEFPRSYATPILWRNSGEEQLVVPGTLRAVGYDLETGEEEWTVRGLARIVNPTPVVGEDGVLYMAAWSPGADAGDRIKPQTFDESVAARDKNGNGLLEVSEIPGGSPIGRRFRQIDRDKDGRITRAEYESMRQILETARNVVLAVRPGGEGDITSSHVLWTSFGGVPYVPSPLLHDGYLFVVKDGGIVSCLDAGTGKLLKRGRASGRGQYYSSPVYGDGKVFLISQRGEATVISAERDWKVLSTASFGEDAYATPAIVGGRVFLRTSGHLYCFGRGERR